MPNRMFTIFSRNALESREFNWKRSSKYLLLQIIRVKANNSRVIKCKNFFAGIHMLKPNFGKR